MVGKELSDEEFLKILAEHRAMESVFMVHLGVDINPLEYQKAALCYYYKTYDLEGAISGSETASTMGARTVFDLRSELSHAGICTARAPCADDYTSPRTRLKKVTGKI